MKSWILPHIATLLLVGGCANKQSSASKQSPVHAQHEEETPCRHECMEIREEQTVATTYEDLALPDYKELIEESQDS